MAFTLDVNAPLDVPLEKADRTMPVKEQVVAQLALPVEAKSEMQELAVKKAEELFTTDTETLEGRRSITDAIDGFGKDSMQKSSKSNKLLQTRIGQLQSGGGDTELVADGLVQLNDQLKRLDPSDIDFAKPKGLLSKIMSPLKDYFQKYEKADKVINEIIEHLQSGRSTLVNDNTTLEIEQQQLRDTIRQQGKEIELLTYMDADIERQIAEAPAKGYTQDHIKFIQEEVLFPLRQKATDIQQMQAVNYQSYFAMEVTRKNNKELIRGVDRAIMLTVTALRTAVTVAAALYHQKIVLEGIEALNKTTSDIITATSRMMREQGVAIQQQAASTAISPETLKEAFRNTFDALDDISDYKQKALPVLKQTMQEFKELANEGERRLSHMEAGFDA